MIQNLKKLSIFISMVVLPSLACSTLYNYAGSLGEHACTAVGGIWHYSSPDDDNEEWCGPALDNTPSTSQTAANPAPPEAGPTAADTKTTLDQCLAADQLEIEVAEPGYSSHDYGTVCWADLIFRNTGDEPLVAYYYKKSSFAGDSSEDWEFIDVQPNLESKIVARLHYTPNPDGTVSFNTYIKVIPIRGSDCNSYPEEEIYALSENHAIQINDPCNP